MRYHIDTIPVWDAYKEDSECPLCDLRVKTEQGYVDSFLGASVMEPAVRVEVNEKGFCGPHFAMMLPQKNRLGLALMTHTHLQQTMRELKLTEPSSKKTRKGLFSKTSAGEAEPAAQTCILCDRLEETMARYVYTVVHLWKTDPAFRQRLEQSKGHCIPHAKQLIAMAQQTQGRADAEAFAQLITRLEEENLARIEKELKWFTLKFDYRNADKPWGESRDALERAINKLRGKYV